MVEAIDPHDAGTKVAGCGESLVDIGGPDGGRETVDAVIADLGVTARK